jgi:hypothetical protein
MSKHEKPSRSINQRDYTCFAKAISRGEHTFTLVAQDKTSPPVIAYWILRNIETAPANKLRCALEDAIIMRANPRRKWAD